MNKILQDQLSKVNFADLSNYDEASHTYHIKKYSKPKFDIGKCYLIKLPGEIIKNPTTVLATNWNQGTAPQFEYLKIYVNKQIGKMLKVDSIAFDITTGQDINIMWSGYLPIDEITQLSII